MLQTLSSTNPQDDAVALMFKTHPDPAERVERLLPALQEQLGRYGGQPTNAECFAKVMRAYLGRSSKEQQCGQR